MTGMDFFSDFCNICYKSNDKTIKNICEDEMVDLKNILINFVGHAVINNRAIYLCQPCCEELIHFNKFIGTCLSSLIDLRQLYFSEVSKLESKEIKCNIKNKLIEFLREQVHKNNCFGKSNSTASISTHLREIVKKCSNVNKNEFDNSHAKFVKHLQVNNAIQSSNLEELKLEIFKTESGEDASLVLDSHNKFTEEELDIKQENSTSPYLEFMKIENEFNGDENSNYTSLEYVKLGSDLPTINNRNKTDNALIEVTVEDLEIKQENYVSVDWDLVKIENEFSYEANSNFIPGEDVIFDSDIPGINNYTNKRDDSEIQFREELQIIQESSSSEGTLTGETINMQQRCPQVLEHERRSLSSTQPSDEHERVHSNLDPHICAVSNRTFTYLPSMTEHDRRNNDTRRHECSVCHKTFLYSSNLTVHKRIHTDSKSYKCTICDRAFKHSSRTSHARIHTGEKPYSCSVCNRSFAQSSTLILHKRTHTGDKPYKCTACDKSFSSSGNLTRHIYTHWDRTKPVNKSNK